MTSTILRHCLASADVKPLPKFTKPEHLDIEAWRGVGGKSIGKTFPTVTVLKTIPTATLTQAWTHLQPEASASPFTKHTKKHIKIEKTDRGSQSSISKVALPATTQTFAPQQAHTSAATSIRLSRLRRLWRRHHEFCHHQQHSQSAASRHLRHNIITEARQLGFRGNPIDSSQLLEAEQWISQQISNEEDAQQQAPHSTLET